MISLKRILRDLCCALLLLAGCSKQDNQPKNFTPIDLSLFSKDLKGFNLLGKFDVNWSNPGFTEEDFVTIHDLGFNFVRLPLDYRTYTQPGNWDIFLEDQVAQIDQAIAWGKQYGIHVCLSLHRAPGYSVNVETLPANQDLDLWTSATAQNAFVNQWAYFSNRYKNISYQDLSFNLVNEPADMNEASYVSVMQKAITKIQDINPDRVIFVDGLGWARKIIPSLKSAKNVIQALHAYDPMTLTHYKASWVSGSDTWPVPVWPVTGLSDYLFGPDKSDWQSSLVLEGIFPKDAQITVNVQQVSIQSTLQIKLDNSEILNKQFVCGPDLGTDWSQINLTQYGYQNISGKDYSVILPANGTKLTISNIAGDWMTYNKITIQTGATVIAIVPGNTNWGVKQDTYLITSDGRVTDIRGKLSLAFNDMVTTIETAQAENIPVMIQEYGVHNQTPHDVTLAFLSDLIGVFNSHHLGYAMWNLSGSMGIIDSGRADCAYESYRGRELDREMTTILQRTGN